MKPLAPVIAKVLPIFRWGTALQSSGEFWSFWSARATSFVRRGQTSTRGSMSVSRRIWEIWGASGASAPSFPSVQPSGKAAMIFFSSNMWRFCVNCAGFSANNATESPNFCGCFACACVVALSPRALAAAARSRACGAARTDRSSVRDRFEQRSITCDDASATRTRVSRI